VAGLQSVSGSKVGGPGSGVAVFVPPAGFVADGEESEVALRGGCIVAT
jgi:hypothetical protein